MPIFAALGTVILGFAVGVYLATNDHVLIGMIVALVSLPFALAVWMKVSDRM